MKPADSNSRAPVKVRIAPSPTGDPHIGTAYIALFNKLFAIKNNGKFVVRIEDTDQQRYRADSEKQILESLAWLGLDWDEGPDRPNGASGPYRQSERLPIYREHADLLIKSGHAYPCFCSAERLADLRKKQMEQRQNPGYDGHCRHLPPEESQKRIDGGEAHTIRLKTPQAGETCFQDELRGEIRFENGQIDDQVLLKSDGFPTYHLAVVVDDHLMGISHVIRGEEWISSTPKHVLLYDAFGWERPVFIHLPLLRNQDKSKISKRKNPTSILFYRQRGILPQALVNFLALMGYHPEGNEEKFTLEELAQSFDPQHIHLGGPVFDTTKLHWLNGLYMRELDTEDSFKLLMSGLLQESRLKAIIELVRERVECFDEFLEKTSFFFCTEIDLSSVELVPKKSSASDTRKALGALLDAIDQLDVWSLESVTQCLESVRESLGFKPKDLFMPCRLALTGRKDSPPLFETVYVLGKEIVRHRLRLACSHLKG